MRGIAMTPTTTRLSRLSKAALLSSLVVSMYHYQRLVVHFSHRMVNYSLSFRPNCDQALFRPQLTRQELRQMDDKERRGTFHDCSHHSENLALQGQYRMAMRILKAQHPQTALLKT
jgi:hypothetical protein